MPKSSNYVCVREGTEVKRVARREGDELVRSGKAVYVPRSVWKKEVRDANKQPEVVQDAPKKPKGNPKGKARKQG